MGIDTQLSIVAVMVCVGRWLTELELGRGVLPRWRVNTVDCRFELKGSGIVIGIAHDREIMMVVAATITSIHRSTVRNGILVRLDLVIRFITIVILEVADSGRQSCSLIFTAYPITINMANR
jgi:hypothetical protein